MKRTWIHTQQTFSKKGKPDLVFESMSPEGSIDWGVSQTLLKATISGWKPKKTKTWKTEQTYSGLRNISITD